MEIDTMSDPVAGGKMNQGGKTKVERRETVAKKVVAKKAVAKKTVAKKAVAKKAAKKQAVKKTVQKKTSTKSSAAQVAMEKIDPRERYEMIAKMAYFRAERRGFEPGWETQDWYESEKIVDEMLSKMKD
jgi:hypothetical protein